MYKYTKKKNWLIFNNEIFNNITETSCNNDTIDGICYKTTLDECLDKCKNDSMCAFGYYIKDKKLCVPLKEHKIKSNPYYKLQSNSLNTNIQTFIDSSQYGYPLNDSNDIYYLDNVSLLNIETGTLLYTDPFIHKDVNIEFRKNNDVILQLLQIPFNYPTGMYTGIKYGDLFNINIPTTNFVLSTISTNFKWIDNQFNDKQTFFSIFPINSLKKIGDNVLYTDTCIVKVNGKQLYIDEKLNLTTIKTKNSTFQFIPKIIVYDCVNDKCVPTSFKPNVYKNSKCWSKCDKKSNNKTSVNIVNIVIVLLIVLIIIIALLLMKRV